MGIEISAGESGAGWMRNSPGHSEHVRARGPAKPPSPNSLNGGGREGLGEGLSLAAGIKEKQGKQPEQCCSLSRDNGVLWGEENEHTERFQNTTDPELIGFLYSIPQTHQACPQFKTTPYWITGLEKNKRASCWVFFKPWVHLSSVHEINSVGGDLYSNNEIK